MVVKTVTETSDTLLNWNTHFLQITNKNGYFVHIILNPHGDVVWLCYLVFLFFSFVKDWEICTSISVSPSSFTENALRDLFQPLSSFALFFLSSSVLFLHYANQFMSDFTCNIVTLTSVFSSSLCCRWYLKQHQLIVLALVLHTRQ